MRKTTDHEWLRPKHEYHHADEHGKAEIKAPTTSTPETNLALARLSQYPQKASALRWPGSAYNQLRVGEVHKTEKN